MSNLIKLIGAVLSVLLLVYLLLPGPSSIGNFRTLPDSVKSTLSGDTVQVPNVVAYFSNNYRDLVTSFYRQDFRQLNWVPFGPMRLNYPPEYAYTAIKVQTQSTFLEEYLYPLRSSLYVNGLEPFYNDGTPKYWGAIRFEVPEGSFMNKTTLRYYPSPIWARIIDWIGINAAVIGLWVVGRRIRRYG